MTVTVYSRPGCGLCTATKVALEARGIACTSIDVDADHEAKEAVKSLGYRGLPVVVVSEERHWGGFRLDLINELAKEQSMQGGAE